MIGASCRWNERGWADPARIAPSLGLFAGAPSDVEPLDGVHLFNLSGPRARPRRGWRAARSASGLPVLLCGWIDDRADLASTLGLTGPHSENRPEHLYAAAFERWGDNADQRINGTYAAIIAMPDGRLRLSRSSLGGFPLFYAFDSSAAVVCSIPRPIFAAGWPQRLLEDVLLRSLALRMDDDPQATAYHGLWQAPPGAITYLGPHGPSVHRYYDISALPETRFAHDDDYVDAARELLARSVRNVLEWADNPAISLSGGLDSSIATAEILRQLPAEQRLKAFTFHPLDTWSGKIPPTNFGDERGHVRAFQAMHPRLDVEFVDNAGIAFDDRAEELFLAGSTAYPSAVLGTVQHGVIAAAAQGKHCLLTAGFGNDTYSFTPPWIYSYLLRHGKWREAYRLAAGRTGDHRSVIRRVLALGLMPMLPPGLASGLRFLVHGHKDGGIPRLANTLLRDDVQGTGGFRINEMRPAHSRRQWLQQNRDYYGIGGETGHAYEQVYGIRSRDVTVYRPLIEFCFSIPDDQFAGDGQDRWLARRMAKGDLPEAQRLERRYGMHNVDWHARLTPRLDDMRRMVDRMENQPPFSDIIDFDKARAVLDSWPAEDPGHSDAILAHRFMLPATLLMSRFVDHVTGANR